MSELEPVLLPGAAVAATSGGASVWCAAAGRLLAFDPTGSPLLECPAPEGLLSLAATADTLVTTSASGTIAWLDSQSGVVRTQLPVGGEPEVMADDAVLWAWDRSSGRVWLLTGEGALTEPVDLPGADRLAVVGRKVWWTSREDTLLRWDDGAVDLEVGAGERGAFMACGNSVWVSVGRGLLRVGTWSGEPGPRIDAPEGPVEHLACAGGILVGGSGRRGLFVLDPSVDAGLRELQLDLGELSYLVATRSIVWAFPAGRPEAILVPVRPAA